MMMPPLTPRMWTLGRWCSAGDEKEMRVGRRLEGMYHKRQSTTNKVVDGGSRPTCED